MKTRPTLKEVRDFTFSSNLYDGSDETRKQQIEFIKQAVAFTKDGPTLLGAHTYIAETIRKSYKYLSPYYQEGRIKSTGSRLFSNIEAQLARYHQASDDWRFINLMKFYLLIKNELSDVSVEKYFSMSKQKLIDNLENRLKRVRKRENTRIAILTNSLPDLELFAKRIPRILPEYKDLVSNRSWFSYTNPTRLRLLEFNAFIMETWKIYRNIPKNYDNLTLEEKQKRQAKDYKKARNILTGAILYVLLRIKKEYKCLSPEGSDVFNKCLKLIGLKSLDDMPAVKKEKKLRALSSYLQKIIDDERYAENVTKAKTVFDLDKYILLIDKYIAHEKQKQQTTKASQNIATVLNTIVQFSGGYALTAVGGAILTSATGGLGAVIYGVYTASGTLLVSMLGQIFYDNYAPPAVNGMYTYMLEKIGNGIASIVVGALDRTFYALYNHKNLRDEERDFIKEWIKYLLLAPESVVSEDEKNQIRYVVGNELLETLGETVPVAEFKNR